MNCTMTVIYTYITFVYKDIAKICKVRCRYHIEYQTELSAYWICIIHEYMNNACMYVCAKEKQTGLQR